MVGIALCSNQPHMEVYNALKAEFGAESAPAL